MNSSDPLALVLADFDAPARALLAASSGTTELIVAYARIGRPISAENYLRLCAKLSVDPLPEIAGGLEQARIGRFSHVTLGMGLRVTRGLKKHSLRDAATAAEISATTLSRMEHGVPVAIENVLKACRYIGAHPFGYVVSHVKQRLNTLNENEFRNDTKSGLSA